MSWKIPICIRVVGKGVEYQTVYFGVRTTLLPSVLTVDPPLLDFGEVTAQQRVVRTITVTNRRPIVPQFFQTGPLPESACFAVLNAPRDKPREISSEAFKLVIAFRPE